MAYRYRGPDGKFVKESTYNRSKAQGGTKYYREKVLSAPRENLGSKVKKERASRATPYGELIQAYDSFDDNWIDGNFEDQGELGTGVDYGEE